MSPTSGTSAPSTGPELADTAPVDDRHRRIPACQDISLAGNREGITRGNRSGLWFAVLDGVRHLRPRLLVVENVAALRRRGLRHLVLAGLAETGWRCRAVDERRPRRRRHRRAAPPRPDVPRRVAGNRACRGLPGRHLPGTHSGQADAVRPAHRDHRDSRRTRHHCTHGTQPHLPHREASLSRTGCSSHRPRTSACAAAANHPPNAAPPATEAEPGRPPSNHWDHTPRSGPLTGNMTAPALPTPTASEAAKGSPRQRGGLCSALTPEPPKPRARKTTPATLPGTGDRTNPPSPTGPRSSVAAPHPVHPGPRGKARLNPAFVEWMMGLPIAPGWVAGIPGLPCTAQLRALGNGVIPQAGTARVA
ncbi:DNA cytosine methyltransferase [Yinghuangia aomiensis]